MYQIDISGDSRFPVDKKRIQKTISRVLGDFDVGGDVSVSVRVVGDRKMKQLNSDFRKLTKTTDVLSFPTEVVKKGGGFKNGASEFLYPQEEPFPLGDVVISFPRARDQAAEKNVFLDDEVARLIEHGVKSLLGMHE